MRNEIKKSCSNCAERFCSVCIAHLIIVDREKEACEFWIYLFAPKQSTKEKLCALSK